MKNPLARSAMVKTGIGFGVLELVRALTDPLLVVVCLLGLTGFIVQAIRPADELLALIAFALSYDGRRGLMFARSGMVRTVLNRCSRVTLLLVAIGLLTGFISYFDPVVLLAWALLTPLVQIVAHLIAPYVYAPILKHRGPKRAVVVGDNPLGRSFAATINADPLAYERVVGFFDDRDGERLIQGNTPVCGRMMDVGQFVRSNGIDQIFLALPIAAQPRILEMITDLHDTTASIWFIADLERFQPVQPCISTVAGYPVLAICESPFRGIPGTVKRMVDIVLASLAVVVTAPLLLAIAIAVKLTSPGPVIFKQRRFGMDGKEIIVYKFRTMTVTEDGVTHFTAAARDDPRVTPLGTFLRRMSLDELPQFFNVLQGRMSVVGPRPHAMIVNTMYRGKIPSYMIRHKVRPGITGWAQVHGLRGGDNLPGMTKRIEYDLVYLRNWSLWLDIQILFRTVALMFRDSRAF